MIKQYLVRCYLHFKFFRKNRIANTTASVDSNLIKIQADSRFSRSPYLFAINNELVTVYYTYTFSNGWQISINAASENSVLKDEKECMGPSGIIDGKEILLVCHSGKMPNRKLKLISYNNKTDTSNNALIATGLVVGDINYPCLVKSNNGFIMFFSVKNGRSFDNYIMTSVDASSWSEPKRLPHIGSFGRRMSCIVAGGLFNMVWEEAGQIIFARSTDGINWNAGQILAHNGNRPKISFVENKLLVSYEQHDNSHSIKLAVEGPEKWHSYIVISGSDFVTRPSNLVNRNGKIIIAWSKITALKEELYSKEVNLLPE